MSLKNRKNCRLLFISIEIKSVVQSNNKKHNIKFVSCWFLSLTHSFHVFIYWNEFVNNKSPRKRNYFDRLCIHAIKTSRQTQAVEVTKAVFDSDIYEQNWQV